LLLLAAAALVGCGEDLSKKSDAELGLNAQQARGRQVYNAQCAECHYAYSSKGSKGPSLKGMYKKQYLPSGLLAQDRFVAEAIVHGRKMMPATNLTQDQLQDLLAYLHTL
jgi:mono/diheme cytochrome c family protein